MKGIDARNEIERMSRRIGDLERDIDTRLKASIRYCPKCKRNTIQQIYFDNSSTTITFSNSSMTSDFEPSEKYICLNCDSKITCTKTEQCKVVKEGK